MAVVASPVAVASSKGSVRFFVIGTVMTKHRTVGRTRRLRRRKTFRRGGNPPGKLSPGLLSVYQTTKPTTAEPKPRGPLWNPRKKTEFQKQAIRASKRGETSLLGVDIIEGDGADGPLFSKEHGRAARVAAAEAADAAVKAADARVAAFGPSAPDALADAMKIHNDYMASKAKAAEAAAAAAAQLCWTYAGEENGEGYWEDNKGNTEWGTGTNGSLPPAGGRACTTDEAAAAQHCWTYAGEENGEGYWEDNAGNTEWGTGTNGSLPPAGGRACTTDEAAAAPAASPEAEPTRSPEEIEALKAELARKEARLKDIAREKARLVREANAAAKLTDEKAEDEDDNGDDDNMPKVDEKFFAARMRKNPQGTQQGGRRRKTRRTLRRAPRRSTRGRRR